MAKTKGVRFLLRLIADHGETIAPLLGYSVGTLLTRAKACKEHQPNGGYAAFIAGELGTIQERTEDERAVILTVLSRHSTRANVILELEDALTYLADSSSADAILKRIGEVYREAAKAKEAAWKQYAGGQEENDD